MYVCVHIMYVAMYLPTERTNMGSKVYTRYLLGALGLSRLSASIALSCLQLAFGFRAWSPTGARL